MTPAESERHDVLIVGGGPGGSTCARALRLGGLDVLLLDQRSFPRTKPCAGWITPQVVESLELDLDEYRVGRTCQPVTGFRCGLIGDPGVVVEYGRTISHGIRRCEFDDYLLRRAAVPLRLEEPVRRIERDARGWLVNGRLRARTLVGAGGHFCPVARQLGARQVPGATVVTAQEAEFVATAEATPGLSASLPRLYYCRDLQGYAWCLRKGEHVNIGVGRSTPQRLTEHVAQFCDFLRESGVLRGEVSERFHGHAYQLHERVAPCLGDDGVLLIGDSAGLAYPYSGEGIRPAVESALIAAALLLESSGVVDRSTLERYQRRIEDRLGRPRRDGWFGWLPSSWLPRLAAPLFRTRPFVRHVVEDWFLHRHQPALRIPPQAAESARSAVASES